MKKLLFFTSFLLCVSVGFAQTYNPANFTVSNKSYGVAQGVSTDARSLFYDGSLFIMRPYQSTAEVLSYLNLAKYRTGYFPILINVGGTLQSGGTFTGGTLTEYWFRNGTTNSDLVLKAVSETDPKRVTGVAVTGTVNKTITLTLADASTVTSTFTDYSADSSALASAYQVDTAKANLRATTALKESLANKGAANGYAPLNGATKIDPSYLPTGSTTYKGTWNASTNTPTLSDGSGTAGWTYTVSVAGTQNLGSGSISWSVGDQAIHNGTIYQRSPSGSAVTSVAGKTGTVVLNSGDVGLGNADNTSDLNKPISTATQAALDAKVYQITGRALSERNLTPADSTKLAAITGTNTGDQDLSGKLDKSDSVLANRITNETTARATADALKADKAATININGNSQTLGSNPSFTISATGITDTSFLHYRDSILNATKASKFYYTIRVDDFGAKGDGTYFIGAAITASSTTLTTSGTTFTSADIGKYIDVGGAGAAGARLVSTIAAVASGTSVTLANAASTTVSAGEGKYGTDNTDFFQNAIYALKADSTINGKIIVPYTGKPYFFSKAPTLVGRNGDSVNYAQIYIPNSGNLSNIKNFGTLEIEGEIGPNFYSDYISRSQNIPLKMVILQSTLDSGTLFGNAYTNIGNICGNGNVYINFTHLKLKNLCGRINSKNGPTHVKPKASAFDISNMAMIDIESLSADTESPGIYAVQPDTTNCWGLKTMSECNWGHQGIDNLTVKGFGNGFSLSEHADIANAYAANCWFGMVVQKMLHGATAVRVLTQWNHYNIKIAAKSYFTIANLDAEESNIGTGGASWAVNVLDVYEPVTTNSWASITYHAVGPDYLTSETNNIKLSTTVSPQIKCFKVGADNARLDVRAQIADGDVNSSLFLTNSSGVSATVSKSFHSKATYKAIGPDNFGLYNSVAGDIYLDNDWVTGKVKLYSGGSSTPQVTLDETGKLGVGLTAPTSVLHTTSFGAGYVAKTASYTLTATDNLVEVTSGTVTQTLPTAVGITGREYWITNTGSGTVTIATTSSQTFGNVTGTPTTLSVPQFTSYRLVSNGTGYLAYKIVN